MVLPGFAFFGDEALDDSCRGQFLPVLRFLRGHRNGALGVEERFENLSPEEGLFDMEDDHLPYEEFEA